MKTITFFNNKGGVGKTTTVVNLASYLKIYMKKKVLLIDLDPQSNSTQLIVPEDKWEEFYGSSPIHPTILSYFEKMDLGEATIENHGIPVTEEDNNYKIDLIPGHPKLSNIDDIMSKSWGGAMGQDKGDLKKLNWLNQLKPLLQEYDYVFIDVGPSLGSLNRSILLNTDFFFAPMGSDIFSLLGIENIASWMNRWMSLYTNTLTNLRQNEPDLDFGQFSNRNFINVDVNRTARFIGYSIQQYSKRKFKEGSRPVLAYEKVIQEMHGTIEKHLGIYIPESVKIEDIKLGDVPYVYSIVPLSQTSHTPIFELTYKSGLRGNQSSSVAEYREYIKQIAENLIKNVGETNE